MPNSEERADLISAIDAAIAAFDQDGRMKRERATQRARRLTGFDWKFLEVILVGGLEEEGMVRMIELAQRIGTTPTTITNLVRGLEDKGLVQRTPNDQDGRSSMISLTDKGRQVAEELDRGRMEVLAQVLDGWSDGELRSFLDSFARLRSDLRQLT